ncbi:MAG TPA: penicillin acylase family protein [Anaeromyxobacteraceae bacterium]|nr:penicillin acylase family protein [Anaeromyxobacteraceae bacterium]
MVRRTIPAVAVAFLAACSSSSTGTGYQDSLPTTTVAGNALLGLGGDVTVNFDSNGIAYIQAGSDNDAAFATGYVHARNRLFQMDFLRKAGRGQLAQMLGPAAVSQDESIRTLFTSQTQSPSGSYNVVDVISETLPPTMQAFLGSYAAGVNRFLEDLASGANGAQTPVEYVALNVADPTHPYVPGPWTIQDSIAIGRLLSFQLSESIEQEAAYGQLEQAFLAACGSIPPASCPYLGLFEDLTRFAPARNTFIVPNATTSNLARTPAPAAVPGLQESLARAAALVARTHYLGRRGQVGSNNWVLDHTMVEGGSGAIVANDPHLALTNPAIWYVVVVSTPTRNVGGVSFPGTPVIEIGHNDSIAWGDTVAFYDVTDLYYFPAATIGTLVQPVTVPAGTIFVRGGSPIPFHVTMIPDYGPIIAAGSPTTPYITARWTGQEPSDELKAFFDLNAATSVYAATSALTQFEVGAQNFVIGDVDGNIAYDPHAYVPVRKPGCFTQTSVPWAPMPGYDGSCVWTGRLSDADLPHLVNPPAHHVVTANNDITGYTEFNQPIQSPSGTYLFAYTDLGYRATEATARLATKSAYTLDDMTSIQADITSLFAEDLVPGLLAWYQASASDVSAKGLGPAVALLAAWADPSNPYQYQTPTGLSTSDPSGAPTTDAQVLQASNASMLFHALVPRLASQILDPFLSGVTYDGVPLTAAAFASGGNDQELAKYLAVLSTYAQGQTPTVPLLTGPASVCGASCAPQAVQALEDTVAFLSSAEVFGSAATTAWVWGALHTVTFDSELAQGGVNLFNYGPFARRGGLYTVDVADFPWQDDGASGYKVTEGPSVRFSAQMVKGAVKWRAVYPGGQADYPGTPTYESQVPAWLANAPGNLPWSASEIEAATTSRIVLTP